MNRDTWNRIRRNARSTVLSPLVRLSIFLCRVLPHSWSHLFFATLGNLAYLVIPRDRERTLTNLTDIYGDQYSPRQIRSMARQVFRNLGHSAADFMIAQSITTKEELEEVLSVEGQEHLEKAYRQGRGVVVVTCHLSCFELLGVYCALRYPTYIVGARIDDEKLNAILLKSRERLGATNIYKGEANLALFKALKKGALLGLLIDQDIKVKSVFVDFFGRPASTPVGPALLAQRTGAVCLGAGIRRIGRKQHLTFTPEIEIARTGDTEADLLTNTRRFSEVTETFIRQAPTQWVWMHRRWKTQPGHDEGTGTGAAQGA
ncbi:MAG: hypothetical protein R3F07_06880 [Opitutaceae bacterium]